MVNWFVNQVNQSIKKSEEEPPKLVEVGSQMLIDKINESSKQFNNKI